MSICSFGIIKMSVPMPIMIKYDNILFGHQAENEHKMMTKQSFLATE
jgi:hypothetical protein